MEQVPIVAYREAVANAIVHRVEFFKDALIQAIGAGIYEKNGVQKVGFRFEVYLLAKRLGLTGWVKNREDKRVEAEIQGKEDKIKFLIDFMKSLIRISIKNVEIEEIICLEDEKEFKLIK